MTIIIYYNKTHIMSKFGKFFEYYLDKNPISDKDSNGYSEQKKPPSKRNDSFSIDLHGFTKDEALSKLRRYIDNVRNGRETKLTIIHGWGIHSKTEPVLKNAVIDHLKYNTAVRQFRPCTPAEGGQGATLAYLKPL